MLHNLPLDFVLSFCREMVPDHGEDSYCYSFCDNAGLLGAFDGCGGAGARKHECYRNHTEAYMASRLCAGAFYDLFLNHFPSDLAAEQLAVELFAPEVVNRLRAYEPPKEAGQMQIRGSMVRTLPTTAAVALVRQKTEDTMEVSALWAGDSRVYVLDANGLAQLTVDDTNVPDPMENLYEDGVLKNIFCSDRKVKLHCATVTVKQPCVVLAATDGCFGYVSTPMEFEGILLHTLLNSDAPIQWESKLAEHIGAAAGDDHTLCLAAFGYGKFAALQSAMSARYAHLCKRYLHAVSAMPVDDRQSRYALWEHYKSGYLRYLEDEWKSWEHMN